MNFNQVDLKMREYLESWSLAVDFFSTPRTTISVPRTPTAALPFRTASRAYSTWKRWPSGENTVIALSYLAIAIRLSLLLYSNLYSQAFLFSCSTRQCPLEPILIYGSAVAIQLLKQQEDIWAALSQSRADMGSEYV